MLNDGEMKKSLVRMIIEVDQSISTIIIKKNVAAIKLEDEGSRRKYCIKRSPKKGGLQMVGD